MGVGVGVGNTDDDAGVVILATEIPESQTNFLPLRLQVNFLLFTTCTTPFFEQEAPGFGFAAFARLIEETEIIKVQITVKNLSWPLPTSKV